MLKLEPLLFDKLMVVVCLGIVFFSCVCVWVGASDLMAEMGWA